MLQALRWVLALSTSRSAFEWPCLKVSVKEVLPYFYDEFPLNCEEEGKYPYSVLGRSTLNTQSKYLTNAMWRSVAYLVRECVVRPGCLALCEGFAGWTVSHRLPMDYGSLIVSLLYSLNHFFKNYRLAPCRSTLYFSTGICIVARLNSVM